MARVGFYVVLSKDGTKGLKTRTSRYGTSTGLTKIDPNDAFDYLNINTYCGEYGLSSARYALRLFANSKKTIACTDLKVMYVAIAADVIESEEYPLEENEEEED